MNKSIKSILIAGWLFLTGLSSVSADAVVVDSSWRYSANVTITEMIEWWNDGSICFKLSNGEWGYVPANEKNLYSLVLSLYISGRTVDIHTDKTNIVYVDQYTPSYRVHRVYSKSGS